MTAPIKPRFREQPVAWLLSMPIHAYRLTGSAWVGRSCRFLPSCSEYALEALKLHGPIKGSLLILKRLGRCRPGGGCGYDPVPPRDAPKS